MKIALISRSAEIDTTRLLLEAGQELGHDMIVVPVLESTVHVTSTGTVLRIRGEELPRPDAVIPRVGTFMPELAMELLAQLESTGVRSLNSCAAIGRARNKIAALSTLRAAGLHVPDTILVRDLEQVRESVERLGGAPIVIKPNVGTQGRGVILAEGRESAVSMIEALLQLNREILLQRYLPAAAHEDRRLVVLGDRVVASASRRSRDGAFRTNLHLGGEMERFEPSDRECEIAIEAARALDLEFAGVDLAVDTGGPIIIEVNSSPGLRGVQSVTPISISRAVIEYLVHESRS